MAIFSILDLCPITEGSDASVALRNALDLAQHAETWGYKRYWVAEHHNMKGIASAATAVVIGHIAGGTSAIRVGAGGIMLPNHAPLVIAEQFGTLAALYPGRIDLGIGRAPGTDQLTAQALRRNLNSDIHQFPNDVVELQQYFKEPREGQYLQAVPGAGQDMPIWILGSSLFGAQLAAELGLPFAFASHFAPAAMWDAMDLYRDRFKPSEQLREPYIALGFNVCAAESDEEARYLRSSSQQSLLRLRRGTPGQLPPPVKNFEDSLSSSDLEILSQMQTCSAVGAPETIQEGIEAFLRKTGANELIMVSSIFDHSARLRSFEITAEVTAAHNAC